MLGKRLGHSLREKIRDYGFTQKSLVAGNYKKWGFRAESTAYTFLSELLNEGIHVGYSSDPILYLDRVSNILLSLGIEEDDFFVVQVAKIDPRFTYPPGNRKVLEKRNLEALIDGLTGPERENAKSYIIGLYQKRQER